MKSMLRLVAPALVVFLLAACATTTGRPFDPTAVSGFHIGTTTEADVQAKLGSPDTVSNQDGATTWVYSFTSTQSNAMSYVPLASMIGGKSTMASQILELTFDASGRLSHVHNQATKQ